MPERGRAGGGPAIPYVAALDGLRGVAVVAVVVFHLQITVGSRPLAPGGYLGVDVFFCLSGYLITTLLLVERSSTGRIDLRGFWFRRARRLLPAMFAVVLAVLVVVALDRSTADLLGQQRGAALSTLAYVANWHEIARDAAYFDAFVTAPLGHTWSLAIEEQFYVVWPLVAVVLLRRSRQPLVVVALGGAVASSVWFVVLLHRSGLDRAYYGTDSRLGGILAGAAVAVLVRGRAPGWSVGTRRRIEAAAIAGAAGLLAVMVLGSGSERFLGRGGLALTAGLSALVLVPVSQWRGPLGRVLEAAPLVTLGRLSYSIYLWHVPVIAVLSPQRTGWAGWRLALVRVAVTGALSVASHRFVEQPIRRSTLRPSRLVPALATTTVAIAAVAALVVPTVTPVLAAAGDDGYVPDPAALSAEPPSHPDPSVEPDPTTTTIGPPATTSAPAVPAPTAAPRPVRSVLVVGDSVAWSLEAQLRRAAPRGVGVTNRGLIGCSIWKGEPVEIAGRRTHDHPECDRWPQRWVGLLDRVRPEVAVLVLGTSGGARELEGEVRGPCDAVFRSTFRSHVTEAIDVLASSGAMVAITTVAPRAAGTQGDTPEEVGCLDEELSTAASARPGVAEVVDLAGLVCPGGHCAVERDGVLVRPDGLHFSSKGDPWVGRWLWEQLLEPARLSRHGLRR